MKKFVIDASVVVKAMLNEDNKIALRLEKLLKRADKNEVEVISSPLLVIEVCNGFRFGIREKSKSLVVFADFLRLPIKIVNLTKYQIEKSLALAYDRGTSVYDASYHILAKANSAIFLTCDNEYYNRARELGDIKLLV